MKRTTNDGFVWDELEYEEAVFLVREQLDEVYELHDDGSETLIDTLEALKEAMDRNAVLAIEVDIR